MIMRSALLLVVCYLATVFIVARAQGEVGDVLAPDASAPKLSATLSTDELSGTAETSNNDVIVLHVTNNGKRPLLLDGDAAQLGGQTPLSQNEIMSPPPKNTLPEDVVEVGLSLGTAGIGSVGVDAYNKSHTAGPAFYGKDDKRRRLAEARFGQRLLYPGESSSGRVFLATPLAASGSFSVPVYSHPDGARLGNLQISVSQSASGAATVGSSAKYSRSSESGASSDNPANFDFKVKRKHE